MKLSNENMEKLAAIAVATPIDEIAAAALLANPYRGPLSSRPRNNPLLPARFQRPGTMSEFRTHLSEKQAEAVLNDEGMRRLKAGEVIRPSDYKTEVFQAAAEGREGLIRNPHLIGHWRSIPAQTQQRTVAVAMLAVAAMTVMGRVFGRGDDK